MLQTKSVDAKLLELLKLIMDEPLFDSFVLVGGTSLALQIGHRLSVDIDLAYLPLEPRDQALINVRTALQRISNRINAQPDIRAVFQDNKVDELRIVVSSPVATIKIEVSPVARGTLHRAEVMSIQESVENEFGYAEIQVVSLPDLYGGKLCAAMDRQHPRDLFDVRTLLGREGISREIFVGFLVYTLSHPRPINEVMSPNWQPLSEKFEAEFDGMTFEKVECEDLVTVRPAMLISLQKHFTERDHAFLMSFKRGQPDWTLFDYPSAADLPAIRWKLQNIKKLANNQVKHAEQVDKLNQVLDGWLLGAKAK
jgi:predicted nucleotidyltransferase component of viral defense system